MHSYQYDKDNRLWTAKGTSPNSPLSYDQYMSYSPAGAIGKKDIQMSSIKNGSTQSYTYWGHYKYTRSDNPYAARYIYDENNNYTLDETLCWDRAGNLSLSASNATGVQEAMYWTEDNRMQLYIRMGGDNSVAYYRYDHTGKREMKLRGRLMDVYNMGNQYKFISFDDMVLYAGDLATFDRQGFKKHYFVEGRRFLTNVGSVGGPNIKPQEDITGKTSELSDEFAQYLDKYFIDHLNSCDPYITENVYSKLTEVKEIARLYRAILLEGTDNIPYYLHTDRLGSGTVVTNEKGDAVHILAYMPYGETLLDLSRGFETPYQFTGYEKDPESGLYYAGARYQVPRLGSFNSTDPLWWKSPDKTSYHYCANNPVMYVDPTGMVIDTAGLSQQGKQNYADNISVLKNSPIFNAYYTHLTKSRNVYYIKEGGGYGGSGSFDESSNTVYAINDMEVLAQELFHAFQKDLNCYTLNDMSVRETEGDLVSTNIIHNLNALGISSSIANGLIWDTTITLSDRYTDKQTSAFNTNVLSPNFDIDFNNIVNKRVQYYREMEGSGVQTPFSYTQSNSGANAIALKYIIMLIYNTK